MNYKNGRKSQLIFGRKFDLKPRCTSTLEPKKSRKSENPLIITQLKIHDYSSIYPSRVSLLPEITPRVTKPRIVKTEPKISYKLSKRFSQPTIPQVKSSLQIDRKVLNADLN